MASVEDINRIAELETRREKLNALIKLFDEEKWLYNAYLDHLDREFEKKLYEATLKHVANNSFADGFMESFVEKRLEVIQECLKIDDEETLARLKEETTIEGLVSLIKDNVLNINEAASRAGMTVPEFQAKMAKYNIKIDNA